MECGDWSISTFEDGGKAVLSVEAISDTLSLAATATFAMVADAGGSAHDLRLTLHKCN